jgi:hypothetical protein
MTIPGQGKAASADKVVTSNLSRRDFIAAIVLLGAAALMLVSAPRTVAQTVTGTIIGTILDAQGAVIANASISARNRDGFSNLIEAASHPLQRPVYASHRPGEHRGWD